MTVGAESAPLAPWLHEAWVRTLRWHFDVYNFQYLGSVLRPPLLVIGQSRARLGEWNPVFRAITISEHHILTHAWDAVLDTLRHEMAHQYAAEVLHAGDPPHGEAWVRACHLLRVEAVATAVADQVEKLEASRLERDRMLQRVKELMALAGSPNEHEAANAMRMAQKYLLKYNLDLRELGPARKYGTRHLGKCRGRFQEYEYALGGILQQHFFVLVIYTCSYDPISDKRGRIVQISGTPENLDIAEYVYNYMLSLLEPLWRSHRRSLPGASGTRLQYWAGLMKGFANKLNEQAGVLSREQGLIWVGDQQLKDYGKYLHPRTRSTGSVGVSRGEGFEAGVRDGRSIQLRRGVPESSGNRGRHLPGPGS